MISDILITLLFVFLNGFFVAAEFAIVKVRSSQLELKAAEGSNVALVAMDIVKNLNAYLSATQLGITLASLGLGWIGESVVSRIILNLFELLGFASDPILAHQIAIPCAFAIITVLHIVFGELAPKSIAIHLPEETTLSLSYPLRFFYIIFKPFIFFLNGFANLLLRILGFNISNKSESHSSEELQLLLEQGKDAGAIEPSEHELIKNVFSFNQISARQIMVPRTSINAIDSEMDTKEILSKVINDGYSRMPVYKDTIDNIVGLVYTKDLLRMLNSSSGVVLEQAIRPPYFVPQTKKIHELLKELQNMHMHMAIVTDEFGGVAGIVTIEDILEELVGEIQDEHDEESPIVDKINEKEYLVNALSTIEDVNEFLPDPLPKSSDYDTVAGLVSLVFGKIPEIGERIAYQNYEITILRKSKQRVLVVKLFYQIQELENTSN
ncbi:MAG: HlyC/CorC family transporter [Cytophagales bacterium]|nr:MAG: HlyC/CorC family transporter [Cytophagales bacterium]